MLKTPRDIVNDRLSWSSNIAIKNHCVFVLDECLKKNPELSEDELKKILSNYLLKME